LVGDPQRSSFSKLALFLPHTAQGWIAESGSTRTPSARSLCLLGPSFGTKWGELGVSRMVGYVGNNQLEAGGSSSPASDPRLAHGHLVRATKDYHRIRVWAWVCGLAIAWEPSGSGSGCCGMVDVGFVMHHHTGCSILRAMRLFHGDCCTQQKLPSVSYSSKSRGRIVA
jgi:hypothetical protein